MSTGKKVELSTGQNVFDQEGGDGKKFPARLQVVKGHGRHKGKVKRIISGTRSSVAQALLVHRRRPLRLDQHEFFLPVYDINSPLILMKCGRQVAKCVHKHSQLFTSSGRPMRMTDIKVGDVVYGLDRGGSHTDHGMVTWKSDEQLKKCLRITTRQGHVTEAATTHLFRRWNQWVHAAEIKPGDKVAVVRQLGEFTGDSIIEDRAVILIAYMIAGGYTPDKNLCTFTQKEGPVLDEFLELVGDTPQKNEKRPGLWHLRFGSSSEILTLVKESGIHGLLLEKKCVPDFVWGLSQDQTALFLNRLWAGDGSATLQGSAYHLKYTSVSKRLCRDIQILLWKFGIPTSLHRWKPTLYKNTDKWAYRLRIETRPGAIRFIEQIGALNKTENLKILKSHENSNRDTYPIEIGELIKGVHRSRPGFQRRGRFVPRPSLRSVGLREKLKHPPSKEKLRRYIEFFESDNRFDEALLKELCTHLDTDLFWDEVVSVEDIGEQPCYDITVAGTESFAADGIITHNSTTLCNLMLIENMVHEAFRTLYVSPSSMQTRQFSNEKLTPTMNDSEIIQDHFVDRNCLRQVYEKTLVNGSHIFLRYAFLSADRARGIPADRLFLDEIQDILKDNVKVIAECLSFSDYGYELYAGTPKTMDNTIEEYWKWSTQMEWVVPCDFHTPRYWNILGVDNIGREYLICSKCGNRIRPETGQWAITNPGGEYVGFHVTQLMVPWKQEKDRWEKEIIWKYENWPTAVFYNEVLGDSHDQASKPITQSEIMQCCYPINKQPPIQSESLVMSPVGDIRGRENYAGVDWGEGRSEGKKEKGKKHHASFTVLTIGTFVAEKLFWPFFIKRYEGREIDPEFIKKDITQLCFKFGVNCIGCDWGHGWGMNSHLINRLGRDKVMEFQYVAKLRERIKWDKLAFNFKVNRSLAIANFITACKDQELLLPKWEEFEPFAKDILGVYIDYNERMKTMYYDHPIDQPDDAMHSMIYARMCGMISQGRY